MTTMPLHALPVSLAPERQARTALYEGTVAHFRFGADAREFTPRLFLAYLDVDALPASLDAVPLWSARRAAPIRFRRGDFFDGTERPLGESVRDLVEERLGHRPTGPIFLLAHLRTLGWLFNPLAVYYCWAPDGAALDAEDFLLIRALLHAVETVREFTLNAACEATEALRALARELTGATALLTQIDRHFTAIERGGAVADHGRHVQGAFQLLQGGKALKLPVG